MRSIAGCFTLIIALLSPTVRAELRLGSTFGDHMVLQQGQPVVLWGDASPGTTISVHFVDQQANAPVDAAGHWMLKLKPLKVNKTAAELTVTNNADTVTLHDVLVGEVWLCTGQSNMAATLKEFDDKGDVAAAADLPMLRTQRVPERPALEPMLHYEAPWVIASPTSASSFSAFGFFMGRKLQKELDEPVGLVVCAWGGSAVAAWMSPTALAEPKVRELIPHDVIGWRENCRPAYLYNGMLASIVPFTARGIVWYQGETEGDPQLNAFAYRTIFPAMITDWRRLWNDAELPFYFVQLPRLIRKPQWPVVREGQAAALALPNTGMMTTIDLGHDHELHPKNKQAFAERMADKLLGERYGKTLPTHGPALKETKFDADAARVIFQTAGDLKTVDGQPPRCFELAGEDHQFVPADAKLEGATVVVRSAKVAHPLAVRYAFADTPDVNLIGAEGLPAAPFRSDDWLVPTSELSAVALKSTKTLTLTSKVADVVKQPSADWIWTGLNLKADALAQSKYFRITENGPAQIVMNNRAAPGSSERSPNFQWRRAVSFEAGATIELIGEPIRISGPQSGIDLEIGQTLKGKTRRWRMTVAPMTIFGFQDDEVRTLGYNLDNCTRAHAYRLAVRADGIAQVYYDDQLLGTLRATESASGDATDGAYAAFGKSVPIGEFVANFDVVSVEPAAAVAP